MKEKGTHRKGKTAFYLGVKRKKKGIKKRHGKGAFHATRKI